MTGTPHDTLGPMPTYEEVQAHIARARAMRAEYVALSLRRLGRLIVGRGAKTGAKSPAAPQGARTA